MHWWPTCSNLIHARDRCTRTRTRWCYTRRALYIGTRCDCLTTRFTTGSTSSSAIRTWPIFPESEACLACLLRAPTLGLSTLCFNIHFSPAPFHFGSATPDSLPPHSQQSAICQQEESSSQRCSMRTFEFADVKRLVVFGKYLRRACHRRARGRPTNA